MLSTMGTPLVMSAALLLDTALGEPRRWHPLSGFGHAAGVVERWLRRADPENATTHANTACQGDMPPGGNASPHECGARLQLLGIAAVIILVVPPVLSCALLVQIPAVGLLVETAVLYLAIGHRSLHEHALLVYDALRTLDLACARQRVGRIVSRDTRDMDATRVAGATVESVLENGNDAVFAALFWFALLGAPGALAYRLINTLDAMWGYRTPQYLNFGRAAARLDDALNLAPARLTALSYALCGATRAALRCWRRQARHWESPNAGPVMAAGAGALGLRLGGGAYYHGQWKDRPALGEGRAPGADDIVRSLRLVVRSLALWLAVAWMIAVAWPKADAA